MMMVLAGVRWKLCGPMHEMRGGMVWRNKCMTGWDYIGLLSRDCGDLGGLDGLIQVDGRIEVCGLFIFYYIIFNYPRYKIKTLNIYHF